MKMKKDVEAANPSLVISSSFRHQSLYRLPRSASACILGHSVLAWQGATQNEATWAQNEAMGAIKSPEK